MSPTHPSYTKEAKATLARLSPTKAETFRWEMRNGLGWFGTCESCGKDRPMWGIAWDWYYCRECFYELEEGIRG